MSTLFIPDGPIPFGTLRTFNCDGVKTHVVHGDGRIVLTDGANHLLAYPPTSSSPTTFERCGANDPSKIIATIESAVNVRLISEHEDEFDRMRECHPLPRHRTP